MAQSIFRTIRNWPKKLVGLHKTENRLDKIERRLEGAAALACRCQLNLGEAALAASGKTPNIYTFLKRYIKHIEPAHQPYFCDLAADFCGKSFVSQHYSAHFIQQQIKDGAAENFIRELRENFLLPAELDLTANHGINRPFKFWSAREKQNYLDSALRVTAILTKLSPYICFGYGTALAARRGGHFIPHDDDCDILLHLPKTAGIRSRAEAVCHVADFLRENGRKIRKTTAFHLQVFAEDGKHFDVFLSPESGQGETAPRADWIPGPTAGFALESLFPAENLSLEGVSIPCPRRIDAYLTAIYGDSWQIPDENFHYTEQDWRRA